MANIPPEIWLHIANFIPTNDLGDLLEVNSVFCNIAMDIRYHEVSITTSAIDLSMKTLKRLSDPFIASRVHRFKLSLDFTDIEEFSNKSSTNSESGPRIGHKLQRTITRITRIFGSSESPPGPPPVTFTDLINEIIDTTKKLVNVRELYIDSWYLRFSSYNFRPLFSSLWSSFGPRLCTLSLSSNLEGYRTLINPNPILDRLQELHVVAEADADGAIPVDVLMPFINSLAPHLTSMRLLLWASFDLSTFFSQLAPFPVLTTLNVRTPSVTLLASQGLIRDSSCTLQRVELRLGWAELMDESPGRWFLESVSDGCLFSHLRILDIYLRDLASGIGFLLGCIQHTSQSLMELIVREQCLLDWEIEAVVDALSSCNNLTYLRMNIWRLDVGLFDRLALKLPTIDRLWLSIENSDRNHSLDTLVEDLGTRSYTWKLKDITILQNGRKADSDAMLAISRSIPSLTSFFSNGHM